MSASVPQVNARPADSPRTERGHLYVKLMHQLLLQRRFGPGDENEKNGLRAQLLALWDGMDAAEQSRVERSVDHPANFVF